MGIAYYSPTTILPLYVSHLTGANVIVGAVPAVVALCWSLPQLLGARRLSSLQSGRATASRWGATRKSYIARTALAGRIPLLMLVLSTALFSVSNPTLALVLFFVCFGLFRFTGGINTPVYYDLVAAVIDPRARARFIGLSQFLGGAIAAAALVAGRAVLDAFPFPGGFVICFAIGFFFVTSAIGCMAIVREPPFTRPIDTPPAPEPHPGGIIRASVQTLRRDGAFRRYLGSRVFVAFASMGQAFFAVHATRQLGASDGDVAFFSAILLAAQTGSTLLWGAAADRSGLRPVLLAAVVLGIGAASLAIAAPTLVVFTIVFALSGAALGALAVTDPGMPLALAETAQSNRALYVAVANTVLAPVYVVAPLVGGAAADAGGYGLTYVIAAGAGGVALALVALRREHG